MPAMNQYLDHWVTAALGREVGGPCPRSHPHQGAKLRGTELEFNFNHSTLNLNSVEFWVAAVAEWSRYRIVAGLVTSSSPVPLKVRHWTLKCVSRWADQVVRPLLPTGQINGLVAEVS
ncbi:hypothetical protein TNCV_1691731 [Trichonephila clavipes]|nr:hypothetical protein TNCV_1691731 [Trichonephila clavipes]